jgi:AraC-like DNA-binding protein
MSISTNLTCCEVPVRIGDIEFRAKLTSPICNSDTSVALCPHNHADYEMLLYRSGRAIVYFGEMGDFILHENDILLIPPYRYHPSHTFKDDHFSFYTIRFSVFERERNNTARTYHTPNIVSFLSEPRIARDETGWIRQLFKHIETELNAHQRGYINIIRSLVTMIIVEAMCIINPDTDKLYTSDINFYNIQRELDIEEFFADRYSQQVSIKDLSEQLHVCVRQTNRIIVQLYGCSFSQKLIDTRIENTKIFLLSTQYSIEEIAAKCGFISLSYFHESFRKRTGISPQKYRKRSWITNAALPVSQQAAGNIE